ncbi:conserved exported hypothetical protein [Nostocoides japonicum T1-X7]|uniref:Uncharacterized protein n=1 Tax=Nostocoides japonicum T1-X7 TaxID=1194083 RepID=A0A077LUW7_9MICO|nr:hypothetical protein [Tetrasphaera japonica]CCH77698.1 conserved exported hypothetical protein [Tetrasphaera japonica T1-X7]
MTQLVGGSLAAVTAAFLGSRLGVAGTLIGTAVASVVSAVGAAVYTESLRKARSAIRTVRTTGPTDPAAARRPAGTVAASDTVATRPLRTVPTGDGSITVQTRGPIRLNLKKLLVATLAIFLIAAAAITGIELMKGSALDGQHGTTISQVRSGSGSSDKDQSPTPSSTPSATQTTSPSSSATSSESSGSASTSTSTTQAPTSSSTDSESDGATSTDSGAGAANDLAKVPSSTSTP